MSNKIRTDKSRIIRRIRNSAIIKNPVLFEAVGLCPVVAIALSLKLALFLSIVTAIEMILTEIFASLCLKNVRRYWRVAIYVIFGTAVLYPTIILAKRFFPELTANLGVFLPLIAINSLIALHCEKIAVKNSVLESFADAVSASFSYGFIVIIVGTVREILASGTIFDYEIPIPVKFPALLMPFGGLLIIGFTAAFMKMLINKKYPDKSPDRAFDTSEIRRSLKGSLRELMNYDFDPFGDNVEQESPVQQTTENNIEEPEPVAVAQVDEIISNVLNSDTDTSNQKKSKKKSNLSKPKKSKKIKKQKSQSSRNNKKINVESSFISVVPTDSANDDNTERTYLDDFSDMLKDLEEYNKSQNVEKTEAPKEDDLDE